MNHAEKVAKRALEALLPAGSLKYRPEQSSGEYDFDLCYGDGAIAALEVTASVDKLR